jgi:hypothetical protein
VVLALAAATLLALVVPAGLVGGALALLGGSLVATLVLLARDGRSPAEVGLTADRATAAELAGGLLVGAAVAGLAVGLIALAGGVRWTARPGAPVELVTGGAALLARLALPAAAEEVALRGYLLQVAARGFGPVPALIGTSLVFSALHAGNPEVGAHGLAGIAAAGLALGALVLRSGGLGWAIGAHLGWNWALAWPADLPVSGLDLADTPGWDAVVSGPVWLSGGAFGPEASLLAAGLLTVGAWSAWRAEWPRRRPGRPEPLGTVRVET